MNSDIKSYLPSFNFFILFSLLLINSGNVLSANNIKSSLQEITFHELYTFNSNELISIRSNLDIKLREFPDDYKLNSLRAQIYFMEKKYTASEGILLHLHKLLPNNSFNNYLLSKLYTMKDSLRLASLYLLDTWDDSTDNKLFSILENDTYPLFNALQKGEYESSENKLRYLLTWWHKQDYTPATIENEFYFEVIKRVDYAFRNYYDGAFLDERGQIFVRYGEPIVSSQFNHTGFSTECWVYSNLTKEEISFDFIYLNEKPYWSLVKGIYSIPGKVFQTRKNTFLDSFNDEKPSMSFFEDRRLLSTKLNQVFTEIELLTNEEDMYATTRGYQVAESFFVNEQSIISRLPFIIVHSEILRTTLEVEYTRLLDVNGQILVETYMGLPLRNLFKVIPGGLKKYIGLEENIVIKEYNYFPITNYENEIEFYFDNPDNANFIDQVELTLPPEDFIYAFEISDKNKSFSASKSLNIPLSTFKSETAFLSDIQVTNRLVENPSGPIKTVKNNLYLAPYPYKYHNLEAPFFIYFEIYNLEILNSKSNYSITYGIAEKDDSDILNKILTLNFGEADNLISFRQNYEGIKSRDFMHYQLDLSEFDEGEYVIKVQLKDENSDVVFEREKEIILYD